MKTTRQTTYLLMERGVEDKQLYKELLKLISEAGLQGLGFYRAYPKVGELLQGLRDEVAIDGEG